MKTRWHASRLFWLLTVAAAASLSLATACSRQVITPGSANTGSSQLPFDRVSESSGISPTGEFIFNGIPEGTVITVRLQSAVSSADSRAGDSFQAVLAEPIVVDGKIVVPSGTAVTGSVVAAKNSGGSNDPGYLRITLASIVVNGRSIPLEASSIFAKGGDHEKHRSPTITGIAT
jgi:hypothetical protein